jgi:hypothetical protein
MLSFEIPNVMALSYVSRDEQMLERLKMKDLALFASYLSRF